MSTTPLTESLDQEDNSKFSEVEENKPMSLKTKIGLIIGGVLLVLLLILIIYLVVRHKN